MRHFKPCLGQHWLNIQLDWLAQLISVTAIHMYSVATHPAEVCLSTRTKLVPCQANAMMSKNFALVTDTQGAPVLALPEESASVLGTIVNPRVIRRKPQGVPIAGGASTAAKATVAKPIAKPGPIKPAAEAKPSKSDAGAAAASSSAGTPAAAASAMPAKRAASGIMSSFAKAANKPARPKEPVKKEPEMDAMSDDGGDDMVDTVDTSKAEESAAAFASRKERQEALRRMMEDDDDDEEESEKEPEEPEPEEAMVVDDPPVEENPPKEEEKPASSGPRRGKRRVMKKKQVQDAEGYLGMF